MGKSLARSAAIRDFNPVNTHSSIEHNTQPAQTTRSGVLKCPVTWLRRTIASWSESAGALALITLYLRCRIMGISLAKSAAIRDDAHPVTWGRRTIASWSNSAGALAMIILCPCLVITNWITLEDYTGTLTTTLTAAHKTGLVQFAFHHCPKPSLPAGIGYTCWVTFLTILYRFLPGPTCTGQLTPGGHLLDYRTNGLSAWLIIHSMFMIACLSGYINSGFIIPNWPGLLVTVNLYSFTLAALVQIKGYLIPSFPEDRKLSGSLIYDFWAGVELNPRLGQLLDLKFFYNGRPGMIAWTLIDLTCAADQFQTYGYVSKSMLVLILLQTTYVCGFFWNESWYTRTVDISHDYFGFMLAWGDTAFLPTFYTLQAQYLARYPTDLSALQTCATLLCGLTGYAIFRAANH